MSTVVIVNPQSRSGATGRRLPALRRVLDHYVPDHTVVVTEGCGHARLIAADYARRGVARLVVAGGDGTVQEVASGVLDAGGGATVPLAVLPMGTGCDLARSLGISDDFERAVKNLAGGRTRCIDAGRMTCQGDDGPVSSYFLNLVSWGLSGWSVQQLQLRGKDRPRHAFSYLAVALAGIIRVRPGSVAIHVDGEVVHDGPLTLATAANGSFFGSGLAIAPNAILDDGALDVVIVPGMPRLHLFGLLLHLKRRRHIGRRGVRCVRGRRIEVRGDAVRVEADGESLGTLPLTIEVLPAAITLTGLPRAG